jgi:hypothetical protein
MRGDMTREQLVHVVASNEIVDCIAAAAYGALSRRLWQVNVKAH